MDINLYNNCICFVYVFTDEKKTGIEFLADSTRDNVKNGLFEASRASVKVIDWDDKYKECNGVKYSMTNYGPLTRKTFIVTREELFRVCNIFDNIGYTEKAIVEIDQNEIIKNNEERKKTR